MEKFSDPILIQEERDRLRAKANPGVLSRGLGAHLQGQIDELVGYAEDDFGAFRAEHGLKAAEALSVESPEVARHVSIAKSVEDMRDRARRRASASTILTGGRGLMEPAPVARRTLLG